MAAVAKLAGVPRVVHGEHGHDGLGLDGANRKYNTLRRLSRLAVDRYVTVSQELGNWLTRDIGIAPARVTPIYNGVDTAQFCPQVDARGTLPDGRSEEHTSELQSLMRNSYAVFCLKKKKNNKNTITRNQHYKIN